MNLLAIMASPRSRGSSARLLAAFEAGFREAGGTSRRLGPARMEIAPCRECLTCAGSGDCVIPDGMVPVERALSRASALVIASPVFFCGFPSQFKALIDRSQAAWERPPRGGKLRPAWAILAGAVSGERQFEGMLLTLKYFFRAHGFFPAGRDLLRIPDGQAGAWPSAEQIFRVRASGRALAAMAGETQE